MTRKGIFCNTREVGCLLFVTLSILYGGAAFGQGRAGCERQTVSMLVSPDDVWVALVQEDICSDGAFVTVVNDVVQLVPQSQAGEAVWFTRRPRDTKPESDVLAVDSGGRPENRPLLQWISATKLQVTVPNKISIGLQKGSYANIEIIVKFDPDDPIEREKFFQERKRLLEEWRRKY